MRSTDQVAYAAGLYEGEGTVGSYVQNGWAPQKRYPRLRIVMTDREPLVRAQTATGLGSVTGPYGPYHKRPEHKPVYHWQVNGFEQTQAVLAMLWPWLSPRRREQARRTLDAK